MEPIRLLIADDHNLLRAGLRGLLENIPGVTVVGEASSGQAALELVESLKPGILMTDITMPGIDGLSLTRLVKERFPATKVIVLSMHTEEQYIDRALHAGAAGYLIKDSATGELEFALRAVAQGDSYLSPAISKRVVEAYNRLSDSQAAAADPLTPRQREVLVLIAEGMTTKAIARRLDISLKTVETHRLQLMERLGIHEIAGLVRYAIKIGLVKQDVL